MADKRNEYDQYGQSGGGRLFNNAMFGFNKEEVLEYLEEMAEENFQRQEAAEQRIRELNQKVQALEANMANQQFASQQSDGAIEEERRQFQEMKNELDLSQAATQQAEAELQEYREQLLAAQKENAWLREEYQKSDQMIGSLQSQLNEVTSGEWPAMDEQVQQLQVRVQQAEIALQAAENQAQAARAQAENAEARAEDAEARAEESARLASTAPAEAAAATILAEANEQADRIREEAWGEKDRLHRQIQNSAGGLATSIGNLRTEISDVEGDVSGVLETVQTALADVLASLGRTEQNLNTLGVQVERFPASSPSVQKPQQQVVYFQPSAEVEPEEPRRTSWRAAPQHSLGSGGFRRVWPEGNAKKQDNGKPFRATYSNSSSAGGYAPYGAEAYQLDTNPEERMRGLAENLVDTLVQMLT